MGVVMRKKRSVYEVVMSMSGKRECECNGISDIERGKCE